MCAKTEQKAGKPLQGYNYPSALYGLRITRVFRTCGAKAAAADNASPPILPFFALQSSLEIGIVPTNRGVVQLEMDHYTANNRPRGHPQNLRYVARCLQKQVNHRLIIAISL